MTKTTLYRYMGLNGIIDTPILLQDVPYIIRYRLTADPGKILVNGDKKVSAIDVFEGDERYWTEIQKGQN